MQQRIYQTKVHDVYELRQHLIDVWHELGQSVINDAIDDWRVVQTSACRRSRQKRAYFKHLIWLKNMHMLICSFSVYEHYKQADVIVLKSYCVIVLSKLTFCYFYLLYFTK